MAVIQANRPAIDDRFNVLGFTIRTEEPLFEIGVAAHPDLLKAENRGKRTARNFYSSRVLRAARSRRGESIYLVPPDVVAQFVGQPRLYFGLVTYNEGDSQHPVSVKLPDAGNMYVSLSGLTERGLRRTARGGGGAAAYGNGGTNGLSWGGDAIAPAAARSGNGGVTAAPAPAPAPYSDGYSDELWKQPAAASPTLAPPPPTVTATPVAAQPTSQGVRRPLAEPFKLVSAYDTPSSWFDALRTQLSHFARGALWFLGVPDTTKPPYSAICQVRIPDGTAQGAHHGTAFFIAPRLLLTAGHVTAGQTDLIIVPGKNGGGISGTTEPYGRFHVTQFANHPSYAPGGDNDMALICVPAANASANFFNLVEELTQSRPEGVVVSGYSALSASSSAIGDFVNRNIDENRQHEQGGYIREIPTDGTFSYDLQTLGGASGAPVYWIEDGDSPQVHTVGVHISGNDDTTNLGCRITQEKLTWIRRVAAGWSQSLTFSMAVRALEQAEGEVDPDAIGISVGEPIEPEPAATEQRYRARALTAPQPDYPNASRFAAAATGNFTPGRKRGAVVDRIVIHITAGGPNINGTIGWFQNPAAKVSSHYIVGRDGEVVQMVRNADTAWHASSSNSRSIGIEHCANKPYSLNRRDLPPTDPQYEGSARLVAWLCQQYGLAADREHIKGHFEISPKDNHDCPTSYWDWDHYMGCVQLAVSQLAAATPATSQGVRAPLAEPLLVGPYDTPSSWFDALRTQIGHFARGLAWVLGVPDTTVPPYSAICQVRVPDGTTEGAHSGTAFFIAPRLLLTAGHVVDGASELIIVPGKNGGGISSTTEPFGRFRVTQFSKHPSYSPAGDNDMALICVPAANASLNYFNLVEELTESRPEGVVVSGYAAWWYATSAVERLVNAVIDENRQHMHGGYIREIPTDGTFTYDLQTLAGTSGSPVYWIEDGASPRVHLVGVHIAANDDRTNKGCRVTQEKLSWIRRIAASWSQTLTFSMGIRALDAPAPVVDDSLYGVDGPIPDDTMTASSQGARALTAPTPEYPQASRFAPADPGNYRATTGRTIERIVIHITDGGSNINGTIGWFQNPAAKVSAHYVIGQNGEVVQMVLHKDVAWHARSANGTSIGIEHVANTRGLMPTEAQYCASAALVTWLCDTYSIPVDRTHILGHSEADTKTTHTGCPNAVWDWNYYMRLITTRTCFARDVSTAQSYPARDAMPAPTAQAYGRAQSVLPGRTARSLGGESPDYVVSLIPQPDKNSCWCASMAMLLSYRRQSSFTAESVANDVGASLATSYGWDLLNAVRDRYGFTVIPQPSNASIYNTPQQWADWLSRYGPLWVVIVGAPHAVVLAGIKGNLADPSSVQVHIFNPWDTRVAFDTDPITFNPPNYGYEDWLPFTQFAQDFGNMAEPDYGNWRILHLPATAAAAQSLGTSSRFLVPPPAPIALGAYDLQPGETRDPIEPSRIPGAQMYVVRGSAGACRWALDQLEGFKEPASMSPNVSSAAESTEITIELKDWPAVEADASPLPLKICFKATRRGAVGDVCITAGRPANLAYGVEATARIDNDADVGNCAAIKVGIDYRFSGLAQGNPAARIDLRLLGDGRYERVNGWVTAQAA